MKNFDTRVYGISDFVEWDERGLLNLSPDFQRRLVWSEKAKSYLIDTILKGKPIPKVIINQELKNARNIRVVVDGQQRLRTIIQFMKDDFKISKAHSAKYAGYTFTMLPRDVQNAFRKYEIGVDLLYDSAYEDILDIFARINTYTITLTKQEKLNAKYLGYFKQAAFNYGLKYVSYFLDGKILTKIKVTRMGEAELVSDLLVAIVGGVQTNKNIESFYKKFEDKNGNLSKATDKFDKIMSVIGAIYPPQELADTNWSRIQLFYTLSTAIGHCLYGLKGPDPRHRARISQASIGKIRVKLDEVSSKYDEVAANLTDEYAPKNYKQFIEKSRRGTTDTSTRIWRTNFVCKQIKIAI